MTRSLQTTLMASLLAAGLCSTAVLAKEKPPEMTEDGLQLVHDSQWGLVYVQPGASLTEYNKVQMLETYVAFKKNWQRDQQRSSVTGRVSSSDMEKIKTRLATEFDEVFKAVLQADDGYPVVDAAGDDVLLLRPAIINLSPNAPDTMSAGRSRSYAESAGEMTIYLEIYDSVTGDLIAKGLDRQADRGNGYMTWQNSVSNKAAADRILKGWAQTLRDALDKAHTEPNSDSDAG